MDSTNSTTKRLIGILVALLILVAGISVYYFYGMDGQLFGEKPIDMPLFVGKSVDDIKTWQEENKINKDNLEFEHAFSDDIQEELVISQEPEAGSKIHKTTPIKFIVSAGVDPDKEYTLPDFKDESIEEITKWFTENHFKNVNYNYRNDDKLPKDTLIEMKPEAGETVKNSEEITLLFSSGEKEKPTEITVPDFKTYRFNQMQQFGKDNQVKVEFAFVPHDKIGPGQYVKQKPNAGTTVPVNSRIIIYLSDGKGIPAQNFVGKTKQDAKAWCDKNKITCNFIYEYSNQPKEKIVAQNPAKGNVYASTKMTFSLSYGKVVVLNYKNKTKAEFDKYIKNLNAEKNKSAKIKVNAINVKSDKPMGTILEQSPVGEVDVGSTITVKVAGGKMNQIDSKSNITVDELKKYLTDNGMKLGTATSAYSDTVAKDKVISNDTGNYPLGSTINYVISKGPFQFDPTPYIQQGKKYSDLEANAKEALKNGWNIIVSYETSTTVPVGSIISGSVSGKTINVTVSTDPSAKKYMPDVKNMKKDDAIAKCKALGLTVEIIEDPLSSLPFGVVSGQSLNPQTDITNAKNVILSISTKK